MTIEMKKVWFVDGQIIEQEIPESEIYKQEPVAWQVMVEDEAMKEFSIKDMAHNWCVQQKLSGSSYIYWIRPLYTTPPPCPTCEALARTVMLDQTSHDVTPPQRKPLTDKQILADKTLRYYFGQNGGAGPVSKQGRKVVDAIEALHDIKENT